MVENTLLQIYITLSIHSCVCVFCCYFIVFFFFLPLFVWVFTCVGTGKNKKKKKAKFAIYETSAETLQKSRDTLFQIWNDCKDDFDHHHRHVKNQLQRELDKIDVTENNAINDVWNQWFVYGMARKVVVSTINLYIHIYIYMYIYTHIYMYLCVCV